MEHRQDFVLESHYPDPTLETNLSFTDHLLNSVRKFGTKLALLDSPVRFSYSSLSTLTEEVEVSLKNLGIKCGDVVCTLLQNSVDFIILSLATCKLGAILCPLNPALKKYEIQKYTQISECKYLIVDDESRYSSDELTKLTNVKELLHLSQLFKGDNTPQSLNKDTNEAVDAASQFSVEDTSFIFFSSGTTGPPKATEISHRALNALLAQIEMVSTVDGPLSCVSSDDVVFGVLPFFHCGGLFTLYSMMAQGSTIIINKRFSEENFLKTIQEEKVSFLTVVPPILDFLYVHPLCSSYDLSSLRCLFVGAARVDPGLVKQFKQIFPNVNVTQLFGMTEAGILIFMTPTENAVEDSVGIPLPGVKLAVRDDHNRNVPFGETGELWIKTDALMNGYKGGERLRPTDWFDTGDIGFVDNFGHVHIVGRKKEMIKVRGWQVSPYELEEAIKSHFPSSVKDCAVVGIAHQKDGHTPKAFIVGDVNKEDVVNFVNDNFISYKHLSEVELIDELPRTASGKIYRLQLAESRNK